MNPKAFISYMKTSKWLLLFLFAALGVAKADVSGAYYDWTVTRQPERPWLHQYDRTLIYKLTLGTKLTAESSFVNLRCDQALDVIRRIDNVTCGAPKIVYVVGWQYSGHDSKYPAWGEVNSGIKRPEDATALDSLKWLMSEAKKFHTIVSVHINMYDAYPDSPLWQEYLTNSVIAKDTNGVPIKGLVWPQTARSAPDDATQSYPISYAQEWKVGLAQRRIDGLLALLPIQDAGTIHIDAFHTIPPGRRQAKYISPYLGYTLEQEAEAQRKIYRYFRDHGVDATAENSTQNRIDPFIGLQPVANAYKAPGTNIPPSLYCGMAGEDIQEMIKRNAAQMSSLKGIFCMHFMPWYWAHVTGGSNDVAKVIDAPQPKVIAGEQIMTGDDVCIPAFWRDHALVAYSRNGYAAKSWELPSGWEPVNKVKISEVTMEGQKEANEIGVTNHAVTLSLAAGEEVLITLAE